MRRLTLLPLLQRRKTIASALHLDPDLVHFYVNGALVEWGRAVRNRLMQVAPWQQTVSLLNFAVSGGVAMEQLDRSR